jgi:formamidopyrimidine-DNA glycosylase
MFKLPEYSILASQINETIIGKIIEKGCLGNSHHKFVQDFLFRASLYPKQPLNSLDANQRQSINHAIINTINEFIASGGRYDEFDLYSQPGGYLRLLDSKSVGCSCLNCEAVIRKIQYLGGANYFRPNCQVKIKTSH